MSAKREEKRNKERFVKVKNLPDNKKCFPIAGKATCWPTACLILVGNDQLPGQTPQTPCAGGAGRCSGSGRLPSTSADR